MSESEPNGPLVRRRDRRGRGRRGPDLMPGPLAPRGVPASRSRRERFDTLALHVVDAVIELWPAELAQLDVAVEDVPVISPNWRGGSAPLAILVPVGEDGAVRPRLVLFRRPLEQRAETREDLIALILTVTCEELSPLVAVPPEQIHPDYPG